MAKKTEKMKIRYVHIRDGTPLSESEIKDMHEFLKAKGYRQVPKWFASLGGGKHNG